MTEALDPLTFVAPDVPIDLDNCAREPIHIPGSVQPRGLLLVVHEQDGRVRQASQNVVELLGRPVNAVVGCTLTEVLGPVADATVRDQLADVPDTRVRNPGLVRVDVQGAAVDMDVVVHRPPGEPGVFVLELEPADGIRPLTYGTTYEGVRDAIAELNRGTTLPELYDLAARHVRRLTGFDRVMVYRFDAEYNGEVVAEAKRGDLEPFFGLHYPASDIPPQARALYEKSWIRLISDVDYVPVPVVPALPQPLDLTYASLRSVSPIHCEYLRNMGVRASMSISLLRDGKLWGMIACHHYAGPHAPSYGVRAAAEFLGVALSLRLIAQVDQDALDASRRSSVILARLVAASRDEERPLAEALTADDDLLDLVPADGVLVCADGEFAGRGRIPEQAEALVHWAAEAAARATDTAGSLVPGGPSTSTSAERGGVLVLDQLPADAPQTPGVAGVLALALPDGGAVVWLRDEVIRTVDWGGDPTGKELVQEGDRFRLSPRRSFDLWRELVRGRSLPWEDSQVSAADELRGHLVEALFRRGQREIRAAQAVQRSLLPARMPVLDGWQVTAHYRPADGGRVGGDWFDVLRLQDGRLAVAVGDVTGHGLAAVGAMGQLRNAVRAYMADSASPARVLHRLAGLARWALPGQMATLVLVVIDPATGRYEYSTAGHLPPIRVGADGVSWLRVLGSPLIGLLDGPPAEEFGTVAPGERLVLLSDGVIERRGESLRVAMDRSLGVLAGAEQVAVPGDVDGLVQALRDPESDDDATLVLIARG
ncbi:SpoIIE family protein phosphatase [Cellulomonas sp. NPDC089187]|uniref:SpoIIE family protein phosphatase n=1 Tax=Cellulomonas sp. NPDC089187 TaxID=3154970 RepID=UPI00344919A0